MNYQKKDIFYLKMEGWMVGVGVYGGGGGKIESVLFIETCSLKHHNTGLRHWNTLSFVEEMAIRILC